MGVGQRVSFELVHEFSSMLFYFLHTSQGRGEQLKYACVTLLKKRELFISSIILGIGLDDKKNNNNSSKSLFLPAVVGL